MEVLFGIVAVLRANGIHHLGAAAVAPFQEAESKPFRQQTAPVNPEIVSRIKGRNPQVLCRPSAVDAGNCPVTVHKLRFQFLQQLFQLLPGLPVPAKGVETVGKRNIMPDKLRKPLFQQVHCLLGNIGLFQGTGQVNLTAQCLKRGQFLRRKLYQCRC